MTVMTWLALSICMTVLAIGGLTLLAERGYQFDLRRKRRQDNVRIGGRRSGDRRRTPVSQPIHRAA